MKNEKSYMANFEAFCWGYLVKHKFLISEVCRLDLSSTYIQFDIILRPHCVHIHNITSMFIIMKPNRNQSESFYIIMILVIFYITTISTDLVAGKINNCKDIYHFLSLLSLFRQF